MANTTCVDCGAIFAKPGRRGPAPKRCKTCRTRPRFTHECKICKRVFVSGRKKQMACSKTCRRQWAAQVSCNRYHAASKHPCANPACSRPRKHGATKYCSRKCYLAVHTTQSPCCLHCGKMINRSSLGPRAHAQGKDQRKYCSKQCHFDARWGPFRPRKNCHRNNINALQTSLKRKCKVLGVPCDPECTRLAVLQRDRFVCQACGIKCNTKYLVCPKTRRIHPKNAELDHIVPLTHQGSPGNVFPNCQCLCRKCNNKKSNRAKGQLRLDIEGSISRWESVDRGRRQPSSSC